MWTAGKRPEPEESLSFLCQPPQKRISIAAAEEAYVEDGHMEIEEFPTSKASSEENEEEEEEEANVESDVREIEGIDAWKDKYDNDTVLKKVRQFTVEEVEEFAGIFSKRGNFIHSTDATDSYIFRGKTSEAGREIDVIVEGWYVTDVYCGLWMAQLKLLLDDKIGSHRNNPILYGYCKDEDIVTLVYKCRPLDTLYNLIRDEGRFPYPMRIKVALQLAEFLEFLHSQDPPLVVRNLESRSIFIDEDFTPIVCGLGMASGGILGDRSGAAGPRLAIRSCNYIDNYYCGGCFPKPKMDVYSFGCLIVAMLLKNEKWLRNIRESRRKRKKAFAGVEETSKRNFITKQGCYNQDLTELVLLAKECMTFSTECEPSASEIVGRLNGLLVVKELNLSTL